MKSTSKYGIALKSARIRTHKVISALYGFVRDIQFVITTLLTCPCRNVLSGFSTFDEISELIRNLLSGLASYSS